MTRHAFGNLLAAGMLPLAIGLLPTTASAEEGVLVDSVPANVDKESALAIVRDSLTYRHWTLVPGDSESVSAKILEQKVESQIRIWLAGRTLRYQESATIPDFVRQGLSSPFTSTPTRWITALREDVAAAMRSRLAPAHGANDRMLELRKMRDNGLISAEEYEKKRAAILRDL